MKNKSTYSVKTYKEAGELANIIICEGDFESDVKVSNVRCDGKLVEFSEPYQIIDGEKSFVAIDIIPPTK